MNLENPDDSDIPPRFRPLHHQIADFLSKNFLAPPARSTEEQSVIDYYVGNFVRRGLDHLDKDQPDLRMAIEKIFEQFKSEVNQTYVSLGKGDSSLAQAMQNLQMGDVVELVKNKLNAYQNLVDQEDPGSQRYIIYSQFADRWQSRLDLLRDAQLE